MKTRIVKIEYRRNTHYEIQYKWLFWWRRLYIPTLENCISSNLSHCSKIGETFHSFTSQEKAQEFLNIAPFSESYKGSKIIRIFFYDYYRNFRPTYLWEGATEYDSNTKETGYRFYNMSLDKLKERIDEWLEKPKKTICN